MSSRDPRRALSFGRFAEEYERWRPTYPADAVDWLTRGAVRVADLGAGTGKLTGRLLERGLTVEAVEPDPDMLAVLHRLHPAATPHRAAADDLPCADTSLDAVLAADAWHWFPHEQAVAEVRRVLRPGGWLGLVWNLVAPAEPWEFELAGIDPDAPDFVDSSVAELLAGFPRAETETATFPWTWHITPDEWRGYLATNSAVAALPAAERQERLDSSQRIVATVCRSADQGTAPLRHLELCLRWYPTSG